MRLPLPPLARAPEVLRSKIRRNRKDPKRAKKKSSQQTVWEKKKTFHGNDTESVVEERKQSDSQSPNSRPVWGGWQWGVDDGGCASAKGPPSSLETERPQRCHRISKRNGSCPYPSAPLTHTPTLAYRRFTRLESTQPITPLGPRMMWAPWHERTSSRGKSVARVSNEAYGAGLRWCEACGAPWEKWLASLLGPRGEQASKKGMKLSKQQA